VELDEDVAVVRFYTYSALGRAAIYLHEDTYPAGTCQFEGDETVIAEGDGGFVF
jgi:hypothetical protein